MVVTRATRVAAVGLMLLCAAGIAWRGVRIYQADQRAKQAAALEAPGTEAPMTAAALLRDVEARSSAAKDPAPAPEARRLQVHVEGAVANPGVYALDEGARVNDAIQAAGGALPDGVPGALNLAAKLTDGAKVYVFTRAELEPASPSPLAQGATYAPVQAEALPGAAAVSSGGGLVDLNTASAADLEGVPGIGPATARAIVDHRTKHGPFKTVDDLVQVTGIGPKTLEKLRPYLKV